MSSAQPLPSDATAPAPARAHGLAITAACYAAMTFLGAGFAIVGVAAKEIGLPAARVGLLVACQQVGFAIGVVGAGLAATGRARARRLAVGCFVLAAALLCSFRGTAWSGHMAAMIGIGIGMGTFEGTTDALLIAIHPLHQSRQINVSHFFVTVGATAITAMLMVWPLDWRTSFDSVAIGALSIGALFAAVRVPAGDAPAKSLTPVGATRRRGLLVALFGYGILVVGAELGTMAFLPLSLVELHGASSAWSKVTLVAFLIGVAGGRMLVGALVPDRRLAAALVAVAAFATIAFAALFGMHVSHGAWPLLSLFAGAGIAGTLPLMLARGARDAGDGLARTIALLKLCIPVGGIAAPVAVSRATASLGLATAVKIIPACTALALVISLGLLLVPPDRRET